MKRKTWFGLTATIGIVVAIIVASGAQAFFPPPTPTGVSSGEVTPPPPDPFKPPPSPPPTCCPCDCSPPVHTQRTPEPATLITALAGITILGGYAARRARKGK